MIKRSRVQWSPSEKTTIQYHFNTLNHIEDPLKRFTKAMKKAVPVSRRRQIHSLTKVLDWLVLTDTFSAPALAVKMSKPTLHVNHNSDLTVFMQSLHNFISGIVESKVQEIMTVSEEQVRGVLMSLLSRPTTVPSDPTLVMEVSKIRRIREGYRVRAHKVVSSPGLIPVLVVTKQDELTLCNNTDFVNIRGYKTAMGLSRALRAKGLGNKLLYDTRLETSNPKMVELARKHFKGDLIQFSGGVNGATQVLREMKR